MSCEVSIESFATASQLIIDVSLSERKIFCQVQNPFQQTFLIPFTSMLCLRIAIVRVAHTFLSLIRSIVYVNVKDLSQCFVSI